MKSYIIQLDSRKDLYTIISFLKEKKCENVRIIESEEVLVEEFQSQEEIEEFEAMVYEHPQIQFDFEYELCDVIDPLEEQFDTIDNVFEV